MFLRVSECIFFHKKKRDQLIDRVFTLFLTKKLPNHEKLLKTNIGYLF
jgi:hypothetical protein